MGQVVWMEARHNNRAVMERSMKRYSMLFFFFFFSLSIFGLQLCTITKEIESGLLFSIYIAFNKSCLGSRSIRFLRANVFSPEA